MDFKKDILGILPKIVIVGKKHDWSWCSVFGLQMEWGLAYKHFFTSSPYYSLSRRLILIPHISMQFGSSIEAQSQVGATIAHLSSCGLIQYTLDLSMMRARLVGVIVNNELIPQTGRVRNFYATRDKHLARNCLHKFLLSKEPSHFSLTAS